MFFRLAETAAIRQVVPPSQNPQALARNEGRPTGGKSPRTAPWRRPLRPRAGRTLSRRRLLYLASLSTLLLIRRRFQDDPDEVARRRVVAEVREGVQWLWNERFIFATEIVASSSNLLIQALILTLIVLAWSRGASGGLTGLILAGFGVGGVLGSLSGAWAQRRVAATTIVLVAPWVWAALPPVVLVAPSRPRPVKWMLL